MIDDDFLSRLCLLLLTGSIVLIPTLMVKRSRSGVRKIIVISRAMSVALFVAFVWVTLVDPRSAVFTRAAFGPRPLGVPVEVLLPLSFLILGWPIHILIRHGLIEALSQFMVVDPGELPEGWKNQTIAKLLVGYVVFLIGMWIWYCESKGI